MSDKEAQSAYERLQSATNLERKGSPLSFIAAALFAMAAVLLLVSVREGVGLRQLLISLAVLAVLNVAIAVVWQNLARRDRGRTGMHRS